MPNGFALCLYHAHQNVEVGTVKKHAEIASLSSYLLCAICIGWSTIVATGCTADAHDAGPQTGWSCVVVTGGAADAHDAGTVTCAG